MAFRPFFLLGALWSGLALACWIALLAGHAPLPSRFDPLGWHIHEMLFGFVLAAVAGFILTAVPNWTGRKCLSGWPLAGLVLLWVLGRIGCAFSALLPAALVAVLDGSFAFALAAIVAVDIVRARNRRNYLMPLPIVLLGIANLLMHAEAVANQAVCAQCQSYGRLVVEHVDVATQRVGVRCKQCGHAWPIDG